MFAILGLTDAEKIGPLLAQKYPNDYFSLSSTQRLLIAPGTAKAARDYSYVLEIAMNMQTTMGRLLEVPQGSIQRPQQGN